MTWSDADALWAAAASLDLDALDRQLHRLRSGVPRTPIVRPCTAGDGVEICDEARRDALGSLAPRARGRLTHFVPASGAATRMFRVIDRAARFPDDQHLRTAARTDATLNAAIRTYEGRDRLAVGLSTEASGMVATFRHWVEHHRYGSLPKGLLPYHRYGDQVRSAAQEHAVEATQLLGGHGPTPLHLTIGAGHEAAFERAVAASGTAVSLSLSAQQRHTDTLAVTEDGEVFRDDAGQPLLRPGGHGALLPNLQALHADLVAIKNIDNVVRDDQRDTVLAWRRALVGRLLELEEAVHDHVRGIAMGTLDPHVALRFAAHTFGRRPTAGTPHERAYAALNRPLRVCAVVRNEGQPGGGPFWTHTAQGTTPQIVESAQIDHTRAEQRALFEASTHFNPVDMVASLRDLDGEPFDLSAFVDPDQWLMVHKSHQGRPLRGLERPGLWNGAMAGWNTVFVEVPAQTFHPVKELVDLLGPGHAPAEPTAPLVG
ncbi:MAG: DUF4301 family protein [Myxococcales bacterium]|nr:DUF4301 family protein [Myxococcales bacterium]